MVQNWAMVERESQPIVSIFKQKQPTKNVINLNDEDFIDQKLL
jgi:hypothetical protein